MMMGVLLIAGGPAFAESKACRKMKKELRELRLKYHSIAVEEVPEPKSTATNPAWTNPTEPDKPDDPNAPRKFDRLIEVLDRIVELKRRIKRASDCKVPPRTEDLQQGLGDIKLPPALNRTEVPAYDRRGR